MLLTPVFVAATPLEERVPSRKIPEPPATAQKSKIISDQNVSLTANNVP